MIIYGTKATPLKSLQLTNETCENCKTKGSIVMSVFSKYAHIFWIPTFPIGRTGVSTCTNCQQTLLSKDMPMFLKMQYEQTLPQTKVPLWTWSGLGLIAILAAFIAYTASVKSDNEKIWINAPVAGDVYQYKTDDGEYSLMKVVDVKPDSVLIQYNEYQVDKMSGVYKLKEKAFAEDTYIFSKADIVNLFNTKVIYGVDRDE